jgi:DNA/RNA non-specific endonuclease
MPTRRRRSRRRRSRRSGSLSLLLVVVLVAGVGYLLVQRGVLPPPGPSWQVPEGNGSGDNSAAIARLGGKVNYGLVDPATGQRRGVTATITPAMVAAAARDELGSAADPEIRPPGLDQLPVRNRARAHLLGRQLGGSGDLPANLVALYQTRANTPVMRDYESAVAEAVRAGETIRYSVRPRYPSPSFEGAPSAIRITAAGDHGFHLDVTIANTPEATIKETSAAAAGPEPRGAHDAGAAAGAAAATG